MRATDLGYTYEDVMAGVHNFRFAKTLANHTRFFTEQIAKHVLTKNTSNNQEAIEEAKRRTRDMSSHYCELANAYGDAWIDLKANWNEEELFSVTRYPNTQYFLAPKGTGYKNCDTDMTNQRIEFYYLGKLIEPELIDYIPSVTIPKSNELHIRSNPFALTRCVMEI
jgi:hypothetical protein